MVMLNFTHVADEKVDHNLFHSNKVMLAFEPKEHPPSHKVHIEFFNYEGISRELLLRFHTPKLAAERLFSYRNEFSFYADIFGLLDKLVRLVEYFDVAKPVSELTSQSILASYEEFLKFMGHTRCDDRAAPPALNSTQPALKGAGSPAPEADKAKNQTEPAPNAQNATTSEAGKLLSASPGADNSTSNSTET